MACSRLEDSTFFELSKVCRLPKKKFQKAFFTRERLNKFFEDLFFGDRLKNFFEDLFFWRTLPLVSLAQARRHGGAFRGCAHPNDCLCPPNENCASPSEDCAPKKLTGSGLLECNSRPATPKLVFSARIFVIFVDSHQIS